MLALIGEALLAYVVIVAVQILINDGLFGLAKVFVQRIRDLPGVDLLIGAVIKREADSFLRQIDSKRSPTVEMSIKIPEKGYAIHAISPPCFPNLKTSRHFPR